MGIEGGIERVGGSGSGGSSSSGRHYYESGWVVIVHRETGVEGVGSSGRYALGEVLMRPILEQGRELGEVLEEVSGVEGVREGLGAMGVLTGGQLPRAETYRHGVIFALAPFLSERRYWSREEGGE